MTNTTNVLLFLILATLLMGAGAVRSRISEAFDVCLAAAAIVAAGWALVRFYEWYSRSRIRTAVTKGGELLMTGWLIVSAVGTACMILWLIYLWLVQVWSSWAP